MKEQAADTVDQPLENVELKVSDLSMENGTAGRKVKQRPRGRQENQQGFQVENISTCWGKSGALCFRGQESGHRLRKLTADWVKEGVKGRVQWPVSGLRGSGMQVGVSLPMG